VNHLLHLQPARIIGLKRFPLSGILLMLLPGGKASPRLEGKPARNAMKPARQRSRPTDRAGFVGEDKESSLEGIFSIVPRAKHSAADIQHHRTMTAQQAVKRQLISAIGKLPKQLAIGQIPHTRVFAKPTDQVQDRIGSS
jgi:hypothetical protein